MNKKDKIKSVIIKRFTEFYSDKNNLNKEIDKDWLMEEMDEQLKTTFKKISVRKLYEECGINPLCIMNDVRWTKGVDKKLICKEVLNEIGKKYGFSELNDNSMNSSKLIDLPKSLEIQHNGNLKFSLSEKLHVKPRPVTLQSIYKKCRDVTGHTSWRDVLLDLGLDYDDIERKRSKNTVEEVLTNYLNYKNQNLIKSYTSINQDDLRNIDSVLWKQLLRVINELDYNFKKYSKFFIGMTCLEYFHKNKYLPSKEVLLSKSVENDFREYLSNQHDVKWDKYPEILQDIVLGMYVRGSSIYGDDNKTSIEKRVTYKIRHWKGKKSKGIYKNSGILINELQSIKNILNTKYDRKQIYNKFRELLDKTITTGINHLSREYIEENEKEFMNSCFKVERIKTNNWGKVLELYGINGDLFLPDRLDVSNRGIKFERLIKNLFSEYLNLRSNRSQLKDQIDFWYKKKQGNMIPDFTFLDKIIDTKFSIGYSKNGFHHTQVSNQLGNYHKTKKDIIILTFNQKEDIVNFNKRTTKIMNLKSLKKFMKKNFGIEIEDYDLKYIFDEINNIKFFRKYN
jgi:hypothetical protein|tara:strand:- start:329 stop:2029 length:1701 start_codon:yes stop_codon:yes gene_type:complete